MVIPLWLLKFPIETTTFISYNKALNNHRVRKRASKFVKWGKHSFKKL